MNDNYPISPLSQLTGYKVKRGTLSWSSSSPPSRICLFCIPIKVTSPSDFVFLGYQNSWIYHTSCASSRLPFVLSRLSPFFDSISSHFHSSKGRKRKWVFESYLRWLLPGTISGVISVEVYFREPDFYVDTYSCTGPSLSTQELMLRKPLTLHDRHMVV